MDNKLKKLPKKQSIGIACCRYNPNTDRPEILLVNKRYTYNFQSFVFGRHKNNNHHLKILFDGMTRSEKQDILSGNYDMLWYKIFLKRPTLLEDGKDCDDIKSKYKTYKKKFHTRKEKESIMGWRREYKRKADHFDLHSTDYDHEASYYHVQKWKYDKLFINDGRTRLLTLINQSNSISTIWEIPKGRKDANESELCCAIREFEEETGISSEAYKIISFRPITINHVSDGVCYVYKYYVAAFNNNYQTEKFDKNILKLTEVIDRKWVSLETCEILEGMRGRLYRLCTRILKNFKSRCTRKFDFNTYDRLEKISVLCSD